MNLTRNPTRWTFYFILPFIVVLLSSTFVFSQPIAYESQTSFPITITSNVATTGNDYKLQNLPSYNFSGKIDLYSGNGGFAPNADGCYVTFVGDDGTKICITTFFSTSAATHSVRGSNAMRMVGTGTIVIPTVVIPVEGVLAQGVVYIDVKGTLKYGPSNFTLTFNGKIGGGGPDFVFTGSFRSTFVLCSSDCQDD